MSVAIEIELDNGHKWVVTSTSLTSRLGAAVLIPIAEIGDMTDEEIGQNTRLLVRHAEIASACNHADYIIWHLSKHTPDDQLAKWHNSLAPYRGEASEIDNALKQIESTQDERARRHKTKQRKKKLTQQRRKQFAAARPEIELALIDRDGYACAACGKQDGLTIDHITPLSKGGADELSNLRFLCRRHNSQKGDRL